MMTTAKMDLLRALVSERLSAAAQEIFKIVERTIIEYEEEMSCSKWMVDRDRRLMDVSKAQSEGSLQMCATDVKLQAGQQQQQQPASIEISVCFNPESTGDHPNVSDIPPHSSPASENDHRRDQEILIDVAAGRVKQECDMNPHLNTLKMTKPFKCPVCFSGFASKRTMVRHFKKHPEDKYSSYQCQFCPCYFFCKSEFIVHTRTHQGDNPEMYREQRDRLLAHREEHTEEKPNQRLSESDVNTVPLNITPYDKNEFDQESLQPLCLYQIQTVTDIDKDSTAAGPVNHIKTEPTETECGVSDSATGHSLLPSVNQGGQGENQPKHFNLKNIVENRPSEKSTELVVQFEAGRAQKPHKCPCCSKCFSLNKTLIRHFKIHTHDKAYQCQLCGRKFCQKSDLANHTRIHTGERPYQCPTCHKSFVQKGNLSVHMRKHADEKPSVPRVQLQL